MAINAKGRDISLWNNIQDWDLFSAANDFVLIRTGQNNYEDKMFRSHYAEAKKRKMRIGLWHFVQPNLVNATEQAMTFVKIYKSLPVRERIIALDCEDISFKTELGYSVTTPIGKSQYTWLVSTMVNTIIREIPDIRIGIYTRKFFWNEWVYTPGTPYTFNGVQYVTPDWSKYWLWVASYNAGSPYLPAPWQTWTFWQDGADLTAGCDRKVDRDTFNGTPQAMDTFFGIPQPVTPPVIVTPPIVVPPTVTPKVVIPKTALRVRKDPSLTARIIGTSSAGEVFELASQEKIVSGGVTYVPIKTYIAIEQNGQKLADLK
jgi:GH25 family lysozyme M1 (1,4-beta-N-acetylmuramidase)